MAFDGLSHLGLEFDLEFMDDILQFFALQLFESLYPGKIITSLLQE